MSRIVFENERPAAQVDPARADVACFVGLVRCKPGALIPAPLQSWLKLQGWMGGPFARIYGGAAVPVTSCVDVPLPVENYTTFTALFDAGGSTASFGTDYVATAVRSFFAQGGKRCYVVRTGDPVSPGDNPVIRQSKLAQMLPLVSSAIDDQNGWHGAGHLAGLPDVSFLALPDLPVLCASNASGAEGKIPVTPSGPEQFVECSNQDLTPAKPRQYEAPAPYLLEDDYIGWAAAVQAIIAYLSRMGTSLREVQFVAAFPMPRDTDVALTAEKPSDTPTQDIHKIINDRLPESGGISSAFLQLAYPWLRTSGSFVLLEGLEPPDGALTGLLARNALTRGAFTSATKVKPSEIFDVSPALPAKETRVVAKPLIWGDNSVKPLVERISLFGFTPSGLALLSDVTTYPGESYRPARIHRLVSVILRACRTLGQDVAFKQNGPALWTRVQTFLRSLMTRLWQLNALNGATLAEAFSVRCDRSTMTQNDLDNGRLVAIVTFNAASTIELIRVSLAMQTSGASAQAVAQLAEAS